MNTFQTNATHELKPVAGSFASGDITTSAQTLAAITGVTLEVDPKKYVRIQVHGAAYFTEEGTDPTAAAGGGTKLADGDEIVRRNDVAIGLKFTAGSNVKLVMTRCTV